MFWIAQKLLCARLLREQGPLRSAPSRPSQNTIMRPRIFACRPVSACIGLPTASHAPGERVGCRCPSCPSPRLHLSWLWCMVRPPAAAANGHDARGRPKERGTEGRQWANTEGHTTEAQTAVASCRLTCSTHHLSSPADKTITVLRKPCLRGCIATGLLLS